MVFLVLTKAKRFDSLEITNIKNLVRVQCKSNVNDSSEFDFFSSLLIFQVSNYCELLELCYWNWIIIVIYCPSVDWIQLRTCVHAPKKKHSQICPKINQNWIFKLILRLLVWGGTEIIFLIFCHPRSSRCVNYWKISFEWWYFLSCWFLVIAEGNQLVEYRVVLSSGKKKRSDQQIKFHNLLS